MPHILTAAALDLVDVEIFSLVPFAVTVAAGSGQSHSSVIVLHVFVLLFLQGCKCNPVVPLDGSQEVIRILLPIDHEVVGTGHGLGPLITSLYVVVLEVLEKLSKPGPIR